MHKKKGMKISLRNGSNQCARKPMSFFILIVILDSTKIRGEGTEAPGLSKLYKRDAPTCLYTYLQYSSYSSSCIINFVNPLKINSFVGQQKKTLDFSNIQTKYTTASAACHVNNNVNRNQPSKGKWVMGFISFSDFTRTVSESADAAQVISD